jgi:predicted AAA+ superfamily ATPase
MRDLAKTQEKLEQTGLSIKEKTQLGSDQAKVFEEAKKAAKENDDAVAKTPNFYYTDFNKFHKKTFTDMKQFHRYVKQTVAKIVMGGNCLYITSDYWKNTKHFTELSNLPCSRTTEAYSFSIINPSFEQSMPADSGPRAKNPMFLVKKFGDVINDYTMEHFYKSVDFVPYLIAPETPNTEIFNMFEGFKFSYVEQKEPVDSVKPWINHILNVICSGNPEQAKKLTQWMAHIIQKPTQKAFAVILYGKQGTGKSILYEFFTRCIGKDLSLQVGKLEDLTQTHNTHVRGKLIINANECTNQPANRDVNILKGLITETDLIINPKNVNQYTVSNFSRIMITSNYKQCMRLDADDRRYFCMEISDKKKNNEEYFAPLVDGLTNERTQEDFFTYLANYDISDFHPQRPPMTNMKIEMIGMQIVNVVAFMLAVCENGVPGLEYEEETLEVISPCADVFRYYDDWCRMNDAKGSRMNKGGFADSLKEAFEIDVVRPRVDGKQIRSFKINRALMLSFFQNKFAKVDFEYVIA